MILNSKTMRQTGAFLLAGTILGGTVPAYAQDGASIPDPVIMPGNELTDGTTTMSAQPTEQVIRSLNVAGAARIERETVFAYANLQPGQTYDARDLDRALKALYDTELFADVQITGADTGNIVIVVQENPVINRIIELYKREGRFAAVVEPKIVQLDQNRVDLIFEISEGAKSKIRQINFIGNEAFPDKKLRKEIYSREAGGVLGFLRSNDAYDADRLAADQEILRAFYLTEGYADFRVISGQAELTPDREDFVLTFSVEEGPRYKFGELTVDSELRDLPSENLQRVIGLQSGDWYDAEQVEQTVTRFSEIAGASGYAYADVTPDFQRNPDDLTVDITFALLETPRVYVDRIDINGNTTTRDSVIRRELRISEGDPFNAALISRSEDRIKSLGFFQEELEITQNRVADDRVALSVDLEERPTGEISLSAGYSSLERLILSASIAQRNFMGKAQQLSAGINYSRYSKSVNLGFAEPYFLGRNILLGGDIYRRNFNSFSFVGNERRETYGQDSTGAGIRLGFPINEYLSAGLRYRIEDSEITLDEQLFFTDLDGDGVGECDPVRAGTYLCNELGGRLTSAIGYTLAFSNANGVRATRGMRASISQDFAGLGGDVKYLRTEANVSRFFDLGNQFILTASINGGYIHPLNDNGLEGIDTIRLSDRFFGPTVRGFDIRGIGPRVRRVPYSIEGELLSEAAVERNALGGRGYYLGRIELEIPVSEGARSFGLRPSAYVDVASVWGLDTPILNDIGTVCRPTADADSQLVLYLPPASECPGDSADYVRSAGFKEFFLGNSPKPRVSVGVGVNWTSPFGPLRLDLAKAIVSQEGDDTKLFSFNVGTQF